MQLLIPESIATPPLPGQKKEVMESKTVERNVLLGKLSLGHGQRSRTQ